MYRSQLRPTLPDAFAKDQPSSGNGYSPNQLLRKNNPAIILNFIRRHSGQFIVALACCFCLVVCGCGGRVLNNASIGAISPTPDSVSFGSVEVGQRASTKVAFVNKSQSSVKISKINVTGSAFALDASTNVPVSLAPGETFSANVHFVPGSAGALSGQVSVTSDSVTSPTAAVSLAGTGTSAVSTVSFTAVSCGVSSLSGSATQECSVY